MEPWVHALRVTDVGSAPGTADEPSLDAFYAASYPRLVRALTAMCGSPADAEELVQDAFVRLVPRWQAVSRYDNPEAWVRQVALRALISRRRRRKVARAAQPELAGRSDSPGPSGDRVDVEATMRSLGLAHRVVLVLHHGLGIPLDDVARELGVPVGTVKSRLSRARAAFVADYQTEPAHD